MDFVKVFVHNGEICQLPEPKPIKKTSLLKRILKVIDQSLLGGSIVYRIATHMSSSGL